MKKMGIEGAGPKIVALTAVYYVIAYYLNRANPNSFMISSDFESLSGFTSLLFVIGVILWLSSVVMLLVHFPKGKLITTGPYKLFLNPLYNAFILFILPTVAFYLNSWAYFGASLVMLLAELTLGRAEENYLKETFGQEYNEYRKKVLFKF